MGVSDDGSQDNTADMIEKYRIAMGRTETFCASRPQQGFAFATSHGERTRGLVVPDRRR